MERRLLLTLTLASCLAWLAPPPTAVARTAALAEPSFIGASLEIQPLTLAAGWSLTLTGPAGTSSHRFDGDQQIVVDLTLLAEEIDGRWRWELRRLSAPEGSPSVQTGTFVVRDGVGIPPTERPERRFATKESISEPLCVGTECNASESFAGDTLRLKQDILRIHFDDTSKDTFPARDWRLEANSLVDNGAEYFALVDATAGTSPLVVDGDVPDDQMRISSVGVGIGTSTPGADLHVSSPDSTTFRLEQDGTGIHDQGVWDLTSDVLGFSIREVLTGRTQLLIHEGSTVSHSLSLFDGRAGVGTNFPDETLHVRGRRGDTKMLVEEYGEVINGRQMLELRNRGNVNFILVNSVGNTWQMIADTTGPYPGYSLSRQGSGVREMRVDNNGNLFTSGSINPASSRAIKENFAELDPSEVLGKLTALPVTSWNYIRDDDTLRHIGPMAEDFYAAFGVGGDDSHISVTDAFGVTVAALQGLQQEKDRQIRDLEERLARLEALLADSTDD